MSADDFSPERQLDVLWRALQSSKFWLGVDAQGGMFLVEAQNNDLGKTLNTLHGSRETIIKQLLAMEVADRLEGKPAPIVADRGFFDAGPSSYF